MRYSSIVIALCILPLAFSVAFAGQVNLFTEQDAVDINALFLDVSNTAPSGVSVDQNTAIIRQRIDCFAQNFSYTQRFKICMNTYQKSVVATARVNIEGRPEIGLFIKNVAYCPIMYNLCIGQIDSQKGNSDTCVKFERQCIDLMLDRYWRGAPLYNNMQLRID